MTVEVRVADLEPGGAYPWLTASLIPRPIAWVSTLSADGVANLAPHSFTTVAGIDPPTLCFTSIGPKDTLRNVRATGEFVLNIGAAEQLRAMNDSGTNFPPEIDEFDAATITTQASVLVAPPRVAGAPVAFECRVSGEYEIGSSVMVFGEVVHIAAADGVLAPDGLPDPHLVAPLARLGRNEWARLGDVFALDRISWDRWQSGQRTPR